MEELGKHVGKGGPFKERKLTFSVLLWREEVIELTCVVDFMGCCS